MISDLWFAEDGSGTDRILSIVPEQEVYEFAGPTFSLDGQSFFVAGLARWSVDEPEQPSAAKAEVDRVE